MKYKFSLTDMEQVERLRIDTHEYEGKVAVHSIVIRQKGYSPIRLSTAADFKGLQLGDQIRKKWIKNDIFHIVSSGDDPALIFFPQLEKADYNYGREAAILLALLSFSLLCYYTLGFLATDFLFVPVFLSVVLVLVATMAFVSRGNVHPDEYVHAGAAQYYKSNWLPPHILSEEISCTYSPYGVSRLNADEIYYLVAGKVAFLTEPFFHDKYKNERMFGVITLFFLVLYTLKSVPARVVALPLLLSPQIWYLFSYCNSGFFALTLAFVAGCQVVRKESMLNRYLFTRDEQTPLWYGLVCGLGFGLLLLLKHNYLAFTLFTLLCYLIFFFSRVGCENRKRYVMRVLLICCMGLVVYGSKKVADYTVNGFEREALLEKAQATCSDNKHDYDGVPIEQQVFTLHMKERGVSLKDMVNVYHWGTKTFKSSFGLYGYFKIDAHTSYYKAFKWSIIAFLCYVVGVIVVFGSMDVRLICSGAIVLAVLLTASSLYHSWVGDFQPQGRYLFPVIGMAGAVFGLIRHHLSERWVGVFSLWLFLLSTYSFIFIALQHIPRSV
ncbi:hypothetical protein [Desulfopila sp. IMCC35008]|uniref:hypothetical protein n=1 Tax=Desulfopila sp. IMCC35008 TaxID=2653858 RepID=UPI0013D1559B|nr:hypothetical protein [Desulfopila sp. IMCC35008]